MGQLKQIIKSSCFWLSKTKWLMARSLL